MAEAKPPLTCKHDVLARSCPHCEVDELEREIARLKERIKQLWCGIWIATPEEFGDEIDSMEETVKEAERQALENARLRDDSEALRLLREINEDSSDLFALLKDGGDWNVIEHSCDQWDDFTTGKTPLEAVLKAKSAIERETEQERT